MQQMTVGEFKSKFSQALEKVKQGQSIGISYGKNKKKVAALVPYNKAAQSHKIKLGLLADKGQLKIKSDFKITDEEFLKS